MFVYTEQYIPEFIHFSLPSLSFIAAVGVMGGVGMGLMHSVALCAHLVVLFTSIYPLVAEFTHTHIHSYRALEILMGHGQSHLLQYWELNSWSPAFWGSTLHGALLGSHMSIFSIIF